MNFNVSIEIKDYVSRMNLGFSLAAPENLSMQNTLSTMTKEEQSKQAIALMATGIYLGSGTGAGNLNLNSALTSLLQSQINKAAGKLLQGTDLSLGMDRYDGSSGEAARTDYTYSFSRRFYNDRIRIIVGGKVQSGAGAPNQGQTFLDNVSLQTSRESSTSASTISESRTISSRGNSPRQGSGMSSDASSPAFVTSSAFERRR